MAKVPALMMFKGLSLCMLMFPSYTCCMHVFMDLISDTIITRMCESLLKAISFCKSIPNDTPGVGVFFHTGLYDYSHFDS